jgi:hypothetical protein
MQLLLSSDQLRVPSEDTVLYTAKQYMQANDEDEAAAEILLPQLVSAPQLSAFALSCAALPADSGLQLLGTYAQQLRELLPLKRIASAAELATVMEAFNSAPPSWRLGSRQITPLAGGVRVEGGLPVEQLKQACRDSFAQQDTVHISSPRSAPLGAVAWQLKVKCKQRGGGTTIGLCEGPEPSDVPGSIYYKFDSTVSWLGDKHICMRILVSPPVKRHSCGYSNYFKLQPMGGDGWDDAVWAAAGLPTAGDTLLELCVHSVE